MSDHTLGEQNAEAITLREVASRAGVSSATASRALNGRDGVDPEVRKRVQDVAREAGYRPNRAARHLAGGRASAIGLVVGNTLLLHDSYAISVLGHVAVAADAHNEGLMLVLDSKSPSNSVDNLIRNGMIDGAIISAVAVGSDWVEELLNSPLPTILIGTHPTRNDIPIIDVDNHRAGCLAVLHLLDHGHRRIGLIAGPPDRVDSHDRLAGYHEAHAMYGLKVDPELIQPGSYTRISGYEAADALLAQEPDAIFSLNDEMAFGLMIRCKELSVRIPEDISLVGFDASIAGDPTDIALTSMSQPFTKMADLAVRSLISITEGKHVPLKQLVQAEVKQRGTVLHTRRLRVDAGTGDASA